MSDAALNNFIGQIDAFSFKQRLSILDAVLYSLGMKKADGTSDTQTKKKYTADDAKDAFGMWRNHTESEDVAAYVRTMRKGRHFAV